jgi:transposase-like protein
VVVHARGRVVTDLAVAVLAGGEAISDIDTLWGEGLIVDGGCLLGPYGKGRSGMAPRKFSQELKDEICREIVSKSRPIAQVAKEHGLKDQTVGNWVRAYRAAHAGEEPELTVSERARLRELERDNRELRMELEFLGKATAFFAKKYR